MPEVRALVPLDYEDKHLEINDVLDVSVEQATEWRAMGKVTLLTTEQTLAAAAAEGHYSDVVGREEVGQVQPTATPPGPQAEDDEDEDQPKTRARRR